MCQFEEGIVTKGESFRVIPTLAAHSLPEAARKVSLSFIRLQEIDVDVEPAAFVVCDR